MDNVIEVNNLVKNFDVSGGFFSRTKQIVNAVDGISFSIPKGESLGLVGHSGCAFSPRCPDPSDDCINGKLDMKLIELETGHWADQCCVNCG